MGKKAQGRASTLPMAVAAASALPTIPSAEGSLDGWQALPLSAICDLSTEQVQPAEVHSVRYVGLEHLDSGDPTLRRWGSHEDVRSAKTQFRAGDILYGKLRPYLDKAVVAPFVGICSTDILVFRPRNGIVNPEFLAAALHTKEFVDHAVSTSSGVHHPRTSWGALQHHPFLVPEICEQRAIAQALQAILRAKVVCEQVIAAARRLKESLLHHLFTYGPVATAGSRKMELRTTRFGAMPASWPECPLSACAFVQTGVAKGRKLNGSDLVELPYLRVANVQDGRLDISEMKTIQLRAKEVERFLLRPGDVVLTEGGDFDKLGRGFIWRGEISPCVHQNHVFAVRVNKDLLAPEFLAYLAQSTYGKSYFLSVAHKTTNLACINATKLKGLPVPLPPVAEQRLIAGDLAAVDSKLAAEEARRAALDNLFKSLLHHLMTGKVRVNHLVDRLVPEAAG